MIIRKRTKPLADIAREEFARAAALRHAEQLTADEEALCDLDELYDSRLADIEDALCELAELMNL